METFAEDKVLLIEIRQPDTTNTTTETTEPTLAQRALKPGAHASAEQVMRLISGRNVELLQMIKQLRPQSLAELARLSGRPTASLTRTLQRLSALGIVVMRQSKGREKIPTVACDCLRFELPLTMSETSKA
jgi:predicted transcriptional regulator